MSNSLKSPYYPYLIVCISTLALVISNGLAIGGIPIFYKPIREEFTAIGAIDPHKAESFIANGANLTFFMSGVFSMIGGWLISRYSIKLIMVAGCLSLGAGLMIHSQSESASSVYISRILMGVALGFVGVTPNVVLVSSWFEQGRGTALGILLTGTSLGGVMIPLIAAPLIESYGWRYSMVVLSLLVWVILLPAIVLFVNDKPQVNNGLDQIDGKTKQGMTLVEAIRTPLFWAFGAAAALVFYPIFATSQQFILYLQSPKIGVSLETAALAQSALFGVSVGGKFLAGYLSDKLSATRVILIFSGIMLIATLILFDLTAGNAFYFLLPFGLGYGGTFVLLQRLAADYFGMREYGKILGTITMIEIIGATIGGRITGYLADKAGGDYTEAFYGVVATTAAAFGCVLMLNLMKRGSHQEQLDFE
ncbi:MAG: MFS transporter [Pyrinomonadaceae bacterium]